jgi:hypothetical protein
VRWAVLASAVLLLFCFSSGPVADTDTYWHLKTGQYILQQRKLPVPDPFAYTTYSGTAAYPGEEVTRYFNLTHEWLAQVFLYASYAVGGFAGLVLMRSLWMCTFCGLAGWIVWRRTGGLYRAVGAAVATMLVAQSFAVDRPQVFSYVFLAAAIAILEARRPLWALPPLLLVWANCHGGFFLGWAAMGAYCGEALIERWRGKPPADEKKLWAASLAAMLVSGLNPNFFNVFRVLRLYGQSPMQTQILEWQHPRWELGPFSFLVCGAAVMLALNWRRTRLADWFLLAPFGVAGFLVYRNTVLGAFVGAILLACHLPRAREGSGVRDCLVAGAIMAGATAAATKAMPAILAAGVLAVLALFWDGRLRAVAGGALALLLTAGSAALMARGAVQPGAVDWKFPEHAADFILQHHIRGRIFNTYTQGGYLLWRLWPEQQVFQDGRALNERIFNDGTRIAANADAVGGASGEELLRQYGIDVIIVDGFDPLFGMVNYLVPALADPAQKEWKLVYRDVNDVIYMRNPPPEIPVLSSLDALDGLERQCAFFVSHDAPACAGGMWDVFTKVGDAQRAARWLQVYRDTHNGVFERK